MRSSPWRVPRPVLVLLGATAALSAAWATVDGLTPSDGVLLLGPLDTDRLQVLLVGAFVLTLLGTVVALVVGVASRRGGVFGLLGVLVAVLGFVGALATVGVCCVAFALAPENARPASPPGSPQVLVRTGPVLDADDPVAVRVLVGSGRVFRQVGDPPPAAPEARAPGGWRVERTAHGPVLRYPEAGGGVASVPLPAR